MEMKFEYDSLYMENEQAKKICEIFGNNDKSEFPKLLQIFVE